jgi:hypothetical protein
MPSTQAGDEYYYATWTGISGDLYYRNCAGADSRTVTNEWLEANIRSKGPLASISTRNSSVNGNGVLGGEITTQAN